MNENSKDAIALLEEIEGKINKLYGDVVALTPDSEYNAKYDVDNKELQKELDNIEKKIGDLQDGMALLNYLRGRLVAIKQSIASNRSMLKCAEHYKKAIEFGYNEALVRYNWGLHDKAWDSRESAITNFERVVELSRADSELGKKAAKEIESIKAKKGGCFIATAVYGSENALEVVVLRSFRDNVLFSSKIGRYFVSLYYAVSPPFARLLNQNFILKKLVRKCILQPIVNFCNLKLQKNQSEK
ncbi:MAG: hypothetical protein GF353_29180 [Candidatus Lokiarchaeota archaeon]|nr:hypothetical protein [Candidatus Lokiarchaeota archaeon]